MTIISSSTIRQLSSQPDLYDAFRKNVVDLYDKMDSRHNEAAIHYGFVCSGCEENCCRTKFYHHTYLECLYLKEGFDALSEENKHTIIYRARAVCDAHSIADRNGIVAREMCPLNVDSQCLLYSHRPMICRLHGIPHELIRPGQTVQFHQGCNDFHDAFNAMDYYPFDRTPLYMEMATLEKRFKAESGINQKVKMTIAEMIMTYHETDRHR